jgi:hypothetical protein
MTDQERKLTEQPSWLDLPEEEQMRHTYWACGGYDVPRSWWKRLVSGKGPYVRGWRTIYHSKDESEADAAIPCPNWMWDGEHATPTMLAKVMAQARRNGDFGVQCRGWRDGKWEILKRWPCGEPLPLEDQK